MDGEDILLSWRELWKYITGCEEQVHLFIFYIYIALRIDGGNHNSVVTIRPTRTVWLFFPSLLKQFCYFSYV